MSGSALPATVLLVAGLGVAAVGAWSAATSRRPAWLGLKPLSAGTARAWGGATAVCGLGAAVWGANLLVLNSRLVGMLAVGLIFVGAGWIVLASPASRRPR